MYLKKSKSNEIQFTATNLNVRSQYLYNRRSQISLYKKCVYITQEKNIIWVRCTFNSLSRQPGNKYSSMYQQTASFEDVVLFVGILCAETISRKHLKKNYIKARNLKILKY